MKSILTLLTLAAAMVCGPAQAVTFTVSGTTAGGPTFNRPLVGFSGLSPVGDAVSYSVLDFLVDMAGQYSFLTTSAFDSYTLLYSPSFDPATPLINGLDANDDLNGNTDESGFTANLAAGTRYAYVVTGFSNADFGAYTITIDGPGAVTAVPEPGSLAMLMGGLALVGAAARRRVGVSSR